MTTISHAGAAARVEVSLIGTEHMLEVLVPHEVMERRPLHRGQRVSLRIRRGRLFPRDGSLPPRRLSSVLDTDKDPPTGIPSATQAGRRVA